MGDEEKEMERLDAGISTMLRAGKQEKKKTIDSLRNNIVFKARVLDFVVIFITFPPPPIVPLVFFLLLFFIFIMPLQFRAKAL